MTKPWDVRPQVGDNVLYDNGGTDINEAGKVERVVNKRTVIVAGAERAVRYIADDVWCIVGAIGPNKNQTRYIKVMT